LIISDYQDQNYDQMHYLGTGTVWYSMQEFQITCVRQNSLGNITHVGIGGTSYAVQTAVDWLRTNKYELFTYKNGYKAYVFPKPSSLGNWFLTTEPDSTLENNLDFLPNCPF